MLRRLGEFWRGQEFAERAIGRIGAAREIGLKRGLIDLWVIRPFGQQLGEIGDDDGIDDFRARRAQVGHRLVEHLADHVEIVRLGLRIARHGFPENAEARAGQRVGVQSVGVTGGPMADAVRGEGVVGVVADHGVEENGEIRDTARHGPKRPRGGGPAGEHAGPAHHARGRPHAGDAVPYGGPADRGKAFLAHGDGAKVRRHACRRAPRRSARGALQVVDVARGPEQRAVGVAGAHLAQGRLADEDRPGLFQLGDHEGVAARPVVLEQHRAQGRRHLLDVGLVLDDDGDPVQGAAKAPVLERRIELLGLFQGVGIERDQGIDGGAFLVVGIDSIKVGLHQSPRAQRARPVGRVNVGDGRLEDIEGFG